MNRVYRARMIPLVMGAIWFTGCRAEPTSGNQRAQNPVESSDAIGNSGTEMGVDVQFRGGKRVAERGFLVKPGDSISFGPAGQPESVVPGFWRSIDAGKYTISFSSPRSETVVAIIELQGSVRWNEQGRVIEGEHSFLRIMTESDVWRNIAKRELLNDRLVLTDESGMRHTVLRIGPGWDFILDEE